MTTKDSNEKRHEADEHPILEVFNADNIVDDPEGELQEPPSTTSDTDIPSPG
jgi:hypothetical protein